MNSRTFYGSKVIHHRFLEDAYNEIKESKHGANIVITGPPNNGEDSDIEIEDEDDIGRNSDMPNKVVGELDVFLDYKSDDSIEEEIRKACRKKTDLPRWKIDHTTASQIKERKLPPWLLSSRFPNW